MYPKTDFNPNGCECQGFRFFWGWELKGIKPVYSCHKFCCRKCIPLSLWFRFIYYLAGYSANTQYINPIRKSEDDKEDQAKEAGSESGQSNVSTEHVH